MPPVGVDAITIEKGMLNLFFLIVINFFSNITTHGKDIRINNL
jgi:hypothetical protein